MNNLQSYVEGTWYAAPELGKPLLDAVTGEPVAGISSAGIDSAGILEHARTVGGPALRALTFHDRALRLKALALYLMERKERYYELSTSTGATRADSWIDIEGGIGTLFAYSGKGRREMPDDVVYLDGPAEPLSKEGGFTGQHVCVPLRGAAVHINAFNFPCWGMLEKLAPTLLAGVPAIVKPASSTAYLTELMFQDMVASETFPEGAFQLICGSTGDLLDRLDCQDAVAFTGSAATGLMLSQTAAIVNNSVRFTMEADSLNCSILGPDAAPGRPEFDLYVAEVAREMTVKAGQKCTAIRRAIVPRDHAGAVVEALQEALAAISVGHPGKKGVKMGALASEGQRREVRERVAELEQGAERVAGDPDHFEVAGADRKKGAFLPPMLLYCDRPAEVSAVHDVEAFGPVSTVMPYDNVDEAIALANRGRGSLVGSLFTANPDVAREIVLGAASHHGRMLVVDESCAAQSTGHGSPLPNLVHGGPGRAGGGEELGGIRGVLHYMQRTALQGSPDMLGHIGQRYIRGGTMRPSQEHLFRKSFHELHIGDAVISDPRVVTLDDIEKFADLTGDHFYAHMDEEAAAANPFFEGRVAHGYFLISAAAGMFVDPAPGPVLANYGLDDLRFAEPVYPGDSLTVHFVCKQKTARAGKDYGEVRWSVDVVNQNGDSVAAYDILTMVAFER